MTRSRLRALVACVGLVWSTAACLPGGGEPVPRALREYLDALRAGNYEAAYKSTQLDDLATSLGPGASVSASHFEAFYRAHGLTEYRIRKVTRLEVRTIEAPTERGSAYFDVQVDLTQDGMTHEETFGVEGEVLGTVQVEPDRISLRDASGRTRALTIDGVATALPEVAPDGSHPLLLLRGVHELQFEGAGLVVITTDPLAVRSGAASLTDGPARAIVVA